MKLYVYDHCPYCVKARMIFGIKNLDFDLVTLLNDDEQTPISMVGVKMVPILEKQTGKYMPESMDIVYYIDANYGKQKVIEAKNNSEIADWLDQSRDYLYNLAMPRWVKSDLEEFKTNASVNYFIKKKENYIGSFEENLADSPRLINMANNHLQQLEQILTNNDYLKENKITEDDVHLFAILRSLSIVKGLKYPEKVDKYRKSLSTLSKINLHDNIAL